MRSEPARFAEAKPTRSGCADAAVVLAGGLEASPLADGANRSVLDLNVTPTQTVLGAWERVFARAGITSVGVVEGGVAPSPQRKGHRVRTLRDPDAYRGPGGAARDAWEELGRPSRLVIVEGSRWAGSGVSGFFETDEHVDVTVGVNADGSPAGIYLASASAVELIARAGYVDLKEQWLPRVRANGMDVSGVVLVEGGTRSVRTLPQLLSIARAECLGEEVEQFRVICPGARVMCESDVVDSIVMPGGVVERGAVVSRSLVLPGGRVGEGEILVDGIARGDGRVVAFGDRPTRVHVAGLTQPGAITELTGGGACAPGPGPSARIAA